MNDNKVIEILKNEAVINPTFNAVCHIFAVRQRTRYKLTLASLMAAMKKEGFKFSKEQYTNVMKLLANAGLGTLVLDSKKRVRALDNIKVTLQSIGKAALAVDNKVKRQSPVNKFAKLLADTEKVHTKAFIDKAGDIEPAPVKQPRTASGARETHYPAFLTVLIEGRLVAFPTTDLKPDNLGEFLVKFKKLSQDKDV